MAVREILLYPEEREALRMESIPLNEIDQEVKTLISDLKETLLAHPEGIGLAAPQIGAHQRVVVVRLGAQPWEDASPDPPLALLNPEIQEAKDRRKDFDGCLSFPGLFGETPRPHFLHVKGWDESGETFHRIFEGFDALLVHHEIDHLEGVLFIDHAETPDDFYSIQVESEGELRRVPLSSTRWKDVFEQSKT